MPPPAHPQFESLAGFSAVIDRLGQFQEVMARQKAALPAAGGTGGAEPQVSGSSHATGIGAAAAAPSTSRGDNGRAASVAAASTSGNIDVQYLPLSKGDKPRLLTLQGLTVCTPDRMCTLVKDLSLKVGRGPCVI